MKNALDKKSTAIAAAESRKKATAAGHNDERRRAFAREYAIDHNGTQAAIRAGYSLKGARATQYRLMQDEQVRDWIAEEEAKNAKNSGITAEKVLRMLTKEAEDAANPAAVRVRATELLAKHLGMFIERQQVETRDMTREEETRAAFAAMSQADREVWLRERVGL